MRRTYWTCLFLLTSLPACVPGSKSIGETWSTDASGSSTEPPAATTGEPTSTGFDAETETTGGETTGGETTGAASTGGSTGQADPDYLRACQPGDFVCDDWGCEAPPIVRPGECYKPCTPDVIGEPDAECDEPERPFCGQVGRADGGDFACNDCAHVCVSASHDQCGLSIDDCGSL